MKKKLWGERFKKDLARSAKEFSFSLETDFQLLGSDVKASMAHALMLAKSGLISEAEGKKLVRGLWLVLSELKKKGTTGFVRDTEDIHTLIQLILEKKVGSLAKKLHTGRSRNDLVATSTKLYLKEEIIELIQQVVSLQQTLTTLAESNKDIMVPGFTHLQRAQIVLLSHQLMAYCEMFERDKSRLRDARERLNECPLGSGALAGSSLLLDRTYVAKLLGFKKPTANSIDSVSDRDFILETVSAIAILFSHISRFAEDWILWASSEFGWVSLSDEYSTGSSLMPHKKNPDMLELARGKTGEAYGNLMSLLVTMKGLPLSYNRDMQEDKRPLFRSIDLAHKTLSVLRGVVSTAKIQPESCAKAVNDSFLYATDILDYLVRKKVAFRDAHDIVGQIVRYAIDANKNLSGLPLSTYRKFSGRFQKDVFDLFDPKVSVTGKCTLGSTNPRMVAAYIARFKNTLRKESVRLKKAKINHA